MAQWKVGTLGLFQSTPYIIHYDAQTETAADGTTIDVIHDQSGNGYDLSVGNGVPFYNQTVPNMINDHPTYKFPGSSFWGLSRATGPTDNQPVTIFLVVLNQMAAGSGQGPIFGSGQTVSNLLALYDSAGGGYTASAGVNLSDNTLDSVWHYITIQYNGASSSMRVDGVQVASGNVGTNGFSSGIFLGKLGSNFWTGLLGEVILTGPCAADQINYIENLLFNKWSLDDAPLFRSAASAYSLSPVTSLTVPAPADIQQADFLLAFTYSTASNMSSTGWATPVSTTVAASGYLKTCCMKVAGASEPASYSFTTSTAGACGVAIMCYSRCTGLDQAQPSGSSSSTTNIPFPSVQALFNKRTYGVSYWDPSHGQTPSGITNFLVRLADTSGAATLYTQEFNAPVNIGTEAATSETVPTATIVDTWSFTLR